MKRFKTDNAPAAIGPYAQAVIHNGLIYISGQIPVDPATGEIVSDDVKDQAHQVMKNLGAILQESGSGYHMVIKSSIFLKSMDDFADINQIYGQYFQGENLPARETVEVSRLPKDVKIEISMIAALLH
ncbi:MAG: RidA family protein [Weeksellaceae bacterium]|nr:RidA family protein [Weeksellaceae bacterium]